MTDTPLVSILVPVYNREHFIEATVRSALAQSYPSIEIVIVDNCSTDRTWELVLALAEEDPRIHCYRNPENIGPVRNWIASAEHASGDYCKILWSDDLMSPEFVEAAMDCFRENEELAFVYSSVAFIDEHGRVTSKPFYSLGNSGLYDTQRFVSGSLLDDPRFPLSPGCALFRTADVRRNTLTTFPNRQGFELANIAIGNDLLIFLLSSVDRKRFCHLAQVHNYFRIHSGSISLSEGGSKLYAFYKLAKCHFAVTHPAAGQRRRLARMNAQIWYFLRLRKQLPAGFSSVGDFYPPGYSGDTGFSVFDLLAVALQQLWYLARSAGKPA